MHAYILTYMHTYMCTCLQTYKLTYIHTYLYKHTYICTYIYTYIHTYISVCKHQIYIQITYISTRTYMYKGLTKIKLFHIKFEIKIFCPKDSMFVKHAQKHGYAKNSQQGYIPPIFNKKVS